MTALPMSLLQATSWSIFASKPSRIAVSVNVPVVDNAVNKQLGLTALYSVDSVLSDSAFDFVQEIWRLHFEISSRWDYSIVDRNWLARTNRRWIWQFAFKR